MDDFTRDLIEFREIISECWSNKTKYRYSVTNEYNTKSRGQCWVTAVTDKFVFGGDVVYSTVNGEMHYWNRFPDHGEVDFTSDQYGGDGMNPVTTIGGVYTMRGCISKRLQNLIDAYNKIVYKDILIVKIEA